MFVDREPDILAFEVRFCPQEDGAEKRLVNPHVIAHGDDKSFLCKML
jgi:hypothetical protein